MFLELIEAEPLNEKDLGSIAYFRAKIREKFEQTIFQNVDLLRLAQTIPMEEVWTKCTFERIEPDDLKEISSGRLESGKLGGGGGGELKKKKRPAAVSR
ncbi:unnamed protein product [Echinostoma caproni]|uniref:Uncharacterized protein n=1 Tax=Echinostoma caproni TaxID=27848 RepID=A0A3P8GN34_9TREM|nr:unnamed protein product [Echinostoma caproni]